MPPMAELACGETAVPAEASAKHSASAMRYDCSSSSLCTFSASGKQIPQLLQAAGLLQILTHILTNCAGSCSTPHMAH